MKVVNILYQIGQYLIRVCFAIAISICGAYLMGQIFDVISYPVNYIGVFCIAITIIYSCAKIFIMDYSKIERKGGM